MSTINLFDNLINEKLIALPLKEKVELFEIKSIMYLVRGRW